jgi:hypothetical protein
VTRAARSGDGFGPTVSAVADAIDDLAAVIRAEVGRIADDPSAQAEALVELFDAIPREERMKLARAVFDRLPPDHQWSILERTFPDDDELRRALEPRRLSRVARGVGQIDTTSIAAGERLTLGLFVEQDVRAALGRGSASTTCARELVLRSTGNGEFQVLHDVFNPRGGYFVTADYSEDVWRTSERLPGHAKVRVGSIRDTGEGEVFEPILYRGGRVDVEIGGRAAPGRLHLGFGIVGAVEMFVS